MRTPVAGWLALLVVFGLFALVWTTATMRALRLVVHPANAMPVMLEKNLTARRNRRPFPRRSRAAGSSAVAPSHGQLRRMAVHWPAHWPPEVVQFPAP
jgi:hypothetical protein